MHESDSVGDLGSYGTRAVPSATNLPQARKGSCSWKDDGGGFWLFGGEAAAQDVHYLNDLWRYNPASGEWTWMAG